MKAKFMLLILAISCSFVLADFSITRGPDIGEIYFKGPTVTLSSAIYRSTDFGETATCADSTVSGVLSADLTPGVLYYSSSGALYISEDYGQQGSWELRNTYISDFINSGVSEGEIFSSYSKHSDDYGFTFYNHLGQGFFGNLKAVEIDNEDNIGYALVRELNVLDSMWLLISYDNFNNLEIQHTFNDYIRNNKLKKEYENGELYLFRKYGNYQKELLYSNDYGNSWELKNTFNCPNLPIISIVGGRQHGEFYMLVKYIQDMGFIKHNYIYHSLDYGETFTVYHTFAFGEEPAYAYFEATPLGGTAPLTVQFTDLSPGNPNLIWGWEWDFDNDGEIDSYEQHPEYTYQDTGYFSVRLHIINAAGGGQEDYAFRENYIHVTEGNSSGNEFINTETFDLSNYPNPFNPTTEIIFQISDFSKIESPQIEIYNLKGQKIHQLSIFNGQSSITWDGTDDNGKTVSAGIYLYKLNMQNSPVKKMLLLK